MDAQHSTDAKVKDFIPETRTVKLRNGMEITVTTPTLGWWFDHLIPKIQELRLAAITPELKNKIIAEVKEGKVTQSTFTQMPQPLLEMALAILVHYCKQDEVWCKANLDFGDCLAVINAFLEVLDIQRVMGFFEAIGRQLPKGVLTAMMTA